MPLLETHCTRQLAWRLISTRKALVLLEHDRWEAALGIAVQGLMGYQIQLLYITGATLKHHWLLLS